MDSVATSSHLPVLMEPHEREALGHELEATLHDLVALLLIGKQLHWAVAAGSELGPVAGAPIEERKLVRELINRFAMVSERARTRMDRLGKVDVASQDVLIDAVRKLEEQQWMLRAQLVAEA